MYAIRAKSVNPRTMYKVLTIAGCAFSAAAEVVYIFWVKR